MAKLSGGSTVNGYTIMHTGQSDILMAMIKQFDGTGSGVDADLLDGLHAVAFAQLASANNFTGAITAPSFIGALTGTASRATGDAAGNIIANTYAPKASPTFTGSVTAPTFIGNVTGTASRATGDAAGNTISTTYTKKSDIVFSTQTEAEAGTDNTKFMSPSTTKNAMLEYVYPIGSIYLNVNNTSPATFLGGTWEALSEGKMLMAQGTTYTAGSTGGEATHTLTIDEMLSHNHSVWKGVALSNTSTNDSGGDNPTGTTTTGYTGGGSAHNNLPPYLSIYMWKRTA